MVGVLLACANPLAFIGHIPIALAYAYRIRVEERVLSQTWGRAIAPIRDAPAA